MIALRITELNHHTRHYANPLVTLHTAVANHQITDKTKSESPVRHATVSSGSGSVTVDLLRRLHIDGSCGPASPIIVLVRATHTTRKPVGRARRGTHCQSPARRAAGARARGPGDSASGTGTRSGSSSGARAFKLELNF
jgi:hypothetical protein